ncbi:MAG: DNA mismatch repair endonuclease MutL [Lachnospiraceae bacterium]
MISIQVLDQVTIDKIAAGEVVERPASVVKELVENAIDAGASTIGVEIKDGGLSLIRVTDNGCGIEQNEVPTAFLRHCTSKIRTVEDLTTITSLGFRGEALSSISAVSQVEVITKTKEHTFGTKYIIEGGIEKSLEETGAPEGTTFLVRQLFYNTPARRKFLKTPMTEASHVSEVVTRLALSHPEISFQFLSNGQSKLHTSGNGDLKEGIYNIYGREIANHLTAIHFENREICITGYIGEPSISRGNRNYESFFINGRYIKSNILSKAIEDAYKDFSMQHKYPFVVLHLQLLGDTIDVNVHPTKMELRFSNQQNIYNLAYEAVLKGLQETSLIPKVDIPKVEIPSIEVLPMDIPKNSTLQAQQPDEEYFEEKMRERVAAYHRQTSVAEVKEKTEILPRAAVAEKVQEAVQLRMKTEERLNYHIIGQVFDTYWLVQYEDYLYIIDQHAAHERVLYEKTLKSMKNRDFTSQYISPPMILSLSMLEAQVLTTYRERFVKIGFEIEEFGGNEYAIRAVPDNLFGLANQGLFIEMLDQLSEEVHSSLNTDMIDEKVASMSCKGAVKGNSRLSAQEVDTLIGELLKLDNPYHCPHGRPIMISMSKRDLEKKFKRIV